MAIMPSYLKGNAFINAEVRRKLSMFELAMALQKFYEIYPSMRLTLQPSLDYLYYSTKAYIEDPQMTFDNSFSNTEFWKVMLSEFKLTERFNSARRFDIDNPSAISNIFDAVPSPKYSDPAFWTRV